MRAVAVLLVLHVAVAHADDARTLVQQANAAYSDLRFAEALELLDRAWRLGDSDPDQLRAIFALAGQAAASTGDTQAAKLWFSRWLCLERGAALPVGTSPKLTAAFTAAREALGGAALEAHARRDATGVELTVDRDPLGMVAAARLGGERRELGGRTAQFAPGDGAVALLDHHGNVLATLDVERALVVQPPARSWYERWPAWAIGAASFAAVGAVSYYVAYDARQTLRDYDAHSSQHQYADTLPYADRLVTAQWISRISFGAAAVSAIVGGVLWQREVTVHASSDGARVAWRHAF